MVENRRKSGNLIPDLGDRYKILDLLGRGGMGEVFLVEDRLEKNEVACKVLHQQLVGKIAIDRFSAEFKITSRLNHPHIIRVRDFGFTSDNRPFYTMDLVPGATLEENADSMSGVSLFSAIFDVCLALDRIHKAGLIHNDVKDRNVLIQPSGEAILMDLGLVCTGLTRTDNFRGTIGFAAPEIIRGDSYDHRSDLYSLGVLIFHVFTGELPVKGEGIGAIVHAQVSGRTIPLSDLRPDLDIRISDVVSRLLAVDPLRRYPSALDVIGALAEVPDTGIAERSAGLDSGYGMPEDFIGRDDLLERLRSRLIPVSSPEITTIMLQGARGMGKTRLAREFKIVTQTEGFRFIQITVPEEGGAALGVPGTALQAIMTEMGDQAADLIEEFSPYLSGLFPEKFSSPESVVHHPLLESDVRRKWFLKGLAGAFIKMVSNRPTTLFVDDFHWADHGTLHWLEEVSALESEHPVLILLAVDEPEWDDLMAEDAVIQSFHDGLIQEPMEMEPLNPDESVNFLETRFGSHVLSSATAQQFYAETGGNPHFMEAVIRDLVQRGYFHRRKFKWFCDLKGMRELPVAEGIHDIIRRRLDNLDASLREILDIFSIFPGPVSMELFQTVTDQPLDAIFGKVRELASEGFLREEHRDSGLTYRFHQNQVRTMVHGGMSGKHRGALHLKAAVATGSIMGEHHHAILAYHYDAGGDRLNAARHMYRAGGNAERLYAYDEAVTYYRDAMVHLEKLNHTRDPELLRWSFPVLDHLARCYLESGHPREAEKTVKRFLRLARKVNRTDTVAGILQNLGYLNLHTKGDVGVAVRYYRQAEMLLESMDPKDPRVAAMGQQLLLNTGIVNLELAELSAAETCLTRIIDSENVPPYVHAMALTNLATCRLKSGADTKELRQRTLQIAEKHAFAEIIMINRMGLVIEQTARGRIHDALETIDTVLKDVDQIGSIRLKASSRLWSIPTLLNAGQFQRADEFLTEIERQRDLGSLRGNDFDIRLNRALYLGFSGDAHGAVAALEQLLPEVKRSRNRLFEINVGFELVRYLLLSHRIDRVRTLLPRYVRMIRRYGVQQYADFGRFFQLVLAVRTGEFAGVAEEITALLNRDSSHKEDLLGLELQALEIELRECMGRDSGNRRKALMASCRKRGADALALHLTIQGFTRMFRDDLPGQLRDVDVIKSDLDEARQKSEMMGAVILTHEIDQLRIRLGKRQGDPDLVYRARCDEQASARLLNTVTATGEFSTMTSIHALETRVGPIGPAEPVHRGVTGDLRDRLKRDSGGKQILSLLDEIESFRDDGSG